MVRAGGAKYSWRRDWKSRWRSKSFGAREKETQEREREKTAGEREKERRESGREGERREGLAMRTSGNASALYGHFWLY